jgi:hypothetical protein
MKSYLNKLSICVGLLLALTACSTSGAGTPPPSTQNPPLLPGAQQVKVQNTGYGRGPVQLITYETDDKPEAIRSFYVDVLIGEGWNFNSGFSTSDALYFGWHESPWDSTYEMTIMLKPLDAERTSVQVELLTQRPE